MVMMELVKMRAPCMKQLAAGWFIKLFKNGVATSFGQREFWYAVKEVWKGAWTKKAVEKGLKCKDWCLLIEPFDAADALRDR